MSATEELRRLLDERGVKWSDYSDKHVLHTSWNDLKCWFNEFPDGFTGWGMSGIGTPEQAIAATLGSDSAPFLVWDDAGHLFITMGGLKTWDVTDDAKTWFAALDCGECEMEPSFTVPRRLDFMQEYRCTECGEYAYLQIATDDDALRYCPSCGKRCEVGYKCTMRAVSRKVKGEG